VNRRRLVLLELFKEPSVRLDQAIHSQTLRDGRYVIRRQEAAGDPWAWQEAGREEDGDDQT